MLQQISLFSDLNQRELEYLSQITTEISFKRGEFIFSQGEASHDFFVIKHGQVEISVLDIFKEKKVLNILKNGEFFGEMALFDKNSMRSATAQAFQNTTLFRIPGNEFEKLLKDQPTISFKLLGTMSKRLKEFMVPQRDQKVKRSDRHAKVISVCAPRDGYGKTTMATTIAWMLSMELPRKVLYVDLDLSYGDGTFLMGVYSPKSIVDMASVVVDDHITEEGIGRFLFKKTPNLSVLPAPKDLVEGERLRSEDFVKVVNACRRYFDYLVIDTSSPVSDHVLNALDMSDQIVFLADVKDGVTLKNNTLFFQALARLNLPESHVRIFLNHFNSGAKVDQYRRLFKWEIMGSMPRLEQIVQETGKLPYQVDPASEYCATVRLMIKNLFHEDSLQVVAEEGLLSRWFSQKKPDQTIHVESSGHCQGEDKKHLLITDENCAPLLKEIRSLIISGFLDRAQEECSQLIGMCQKSAPMLRILGEIFFLKKDYARSLDIFDKVLDLDPEDSFSLGHLGHLRGDETLQNRALQILTAKLTKCPDFPDLMNDMGRMLLLFGKHEEARTIFERALRVNPRYSEARVNLSLACGEAGKLDEAISHLMEIEDKNTRVYYLLGTYFFHSGRYFESMAAFTKVSETNPHYSDTEDRLDSLREYFSKINNLLEMHKRLARQSPNFPDIHLRTGNLYLLVGRREEGIAEIERALALKQDYPEASKRLDEVKNMRSILPESFLRELDVSNIVPRGVVEESHDPLAPVLPVNTENAGISAAEKEWSGTFVQ